MLESSLIQSTSSWPFVEVRKLLRERKSIIEKNGKLPNIAILTHANTENRKAC